jgi:hypothetical protein
MEFRLRPIARWLIAALAAAVALEPAPSAGQSRADQVVTAWLQCDDCQAGELQAVVRLGQSVAPRLAGILNDGLPAATRDRLRRELEVRHDELAAFGQRNAHARLASSKEDFVATNMSNFEAQYRVRAAQALAAIGGTNARQSLESALSKTERPDVRRVIEESMGKVKQ